jgi:hypothetical protein
MISKYIMHGENRKAEGYKINITEVKLPFLFPPSMETVPRGTQTGPASDRPS